MSEETSNVRVVETPGGSYVVQVLSRGLFGLGGMKWRFHCQYPYNDRFGAIKEAEMLRDYPDGKVVG